MNLACVQAKLKLIAAVNSDNTSTIGNLDITTKDEKERLRKKELKKIMKKFGISKYERETMELASDYQDRAGERRKVKGSNLEAFKIERASLDKPIGKDNKGFKLLEKLGWQKDDLKDTKLIETKPKDNRKGLGF